MSTIQEENYALQQAKAQLDSIKEMVSALNAANEDIDGNPDEALEAIQNDPLSVQVRSGWYTPGEDSAPEEFMILLCTGGPAVRIVGDLDEYMQPVNPRVQYQDWGTPWTNYPLTNGEHNAVRDYCQQFYYGE